MKPGQYVVVTTQHRGVFGGVLVERVGESEVVLADARVCIHWSSETRGFIGLAVTGPLNGSRVSQPAPQLILTGVTSVAACTDAARQQWEAAPWS